MLRPDLAKWGQSSAEIYELSVHAPIHAAMTVFRRSTPSAHWAATRRSGRLNPDAGTRPSWSECISTKSGGQTLCSTAGRVVVSPFLPIRAAAVSRGCAHERADSTQPAWLRLDPQKLGRWAETNLGRIAGHSTLWRIVLGSDSCPVLLVCRCHMRGEQMTKCFGSHMRFAYFLAFGPIVASASATFRCRLQHADVERRGRSLLLTLCCQAQESAHVMQTLLKYASRQTASYLLKDCMPRRTFIRNNAL